MSVLVTTSTATTSSRRREAPHRRSTGTRSTSLAPGPDGTWVAIVDAARGVAARRRRHVDARSRRPTSTSPSSCTRTATSCSRARTTHALLRSRTTARSTPVPGFDDVAGRDEWHAVGIPLHVRSMTAPPTAAPCSSTCTWVASRARSTGATPGRPRSRSTTTCTRCVAHPTVPSIVVAAASVGLCRSTDGGATWSTHDRRPRRRRTRAASPSSTTTVARDACPTARSPSGRPSTARPVDGGPARAGGGRAARRRLRGNVDTDASRATGKGQVALVDGGGDVWPSADGCDRLDPPRRARRRRPRRRHRLRRRAVASAPDRDGQPNYDAPA